MKKIGIITLNGNFNYGNRLQNYALCKYLEKMNNKVDTLWFCDYKGYIKEIIKRVVYFFNYRKHSFLSFTDKNLNVKYFLKNDVNKKYDYFIVGSDQVWNYSFPDFNTSFFLYFSDYEKNISYSASFGVDDIPDELLDVYRNGINNIKYISTRENNGLNILKKITDRKCEVLIDPTLLLNSDDWNLIAKKPKKIKDRKFVLCYFLGKISDDINRNISRFAKENDCEIINLFDSNDICYSSGPQEFLWLEKNATLICTDSFHSSVFAFLFDVPFVVFERNDEEKNMYSRIETLLSKFQLNNRKYNGNEITKQNFFHDYTESYKLLEIERKKSRDFLEKALNNK